MAKTFYVMKMKQKPSSSERNCNQSQSVFLRFSLAVSYSKLMYCFVCDISTDISLITLQLKVLKQSRSHYCVSLGCYFLVMLA